MSNALKAKLKLLDSLRGINWQFGPGTVVKESSIVLASQVILEVWCSIKVEPWHITTTNACEVNIYYMDKMDDFLVISVNSTTSGYTAHQASSSVEDSCRYPEPVSNRNVMHQVLEKLKEGLGL